MSKELVKRILSSVILIPISIFFIIKGSFLFSLFIIIFFLISLQEWLMMSKNSPYKIFGIIFLFFSFFTIYKLRINHDNDYWFFLFVTTICISTDIGGFIFGKTFKGPKLTKLSPNKTYAGLFGAFIFSVIFAIIFTKYYPSKIFNLNIFIFVILISSVSQFGDIAVSYFKRLSKIKDTGNIIPGHGGVLDRIDGMIFAFPLSYFIFLTDYIK